MKIFQNHFHRPDTQWKAHKDTIYRFFLFMHKRFSFYRRGARDGGEKSFLRKPEFSVLCEKSTGKHWFELSYAVLWYQLRGNLVNQKKVRCLWAERHLERFPICFMTAVIFDTRAEWKSEIYIYKQAMCEQFHVERRSCLSVDSEIVMCRCT